MRYFAALVALLFSVTVWGQILNPVKWSTAYKQVSATEFDLIFTATIDDGWDIYSQFLESDEGPVATSFNFEAGAHYKLVGKCEESGNKKTTYDKVFDMKLTKFSQKGIFTQRVAVSDLSKPVIGYLEFMTCDNERCLPPKAIDFEFILKDSGAGSNQQPDKSSTGSASGSGAAPSNEKEQEQNPSAEVAPINMFEPVSPALAPNLVKPAKWQFDYKKISDTEYDLLFTATMDKGWNMYSQYTDPDNGPLPTTFTFASGAHFVPEGQTAEKGKTKKAADPLFAGAMVVKFVESPIVFTQRVKVTDPAQPILGFIEYMACDDEQCVTGSDEFRFNLSADAAQAYVGAKIEGDVIDQVIPALQAGYQEPLSNCGEEETGDRSSMLWTFLFGFIGGLLALLTPCVFPLIPLTVTFFTKRSTDRKKGLRNALLYGASIIVIYVTIGLLITALFGDSALNALSTNWIANTLFFLIFVVFALSFFGLFEITLPSSWGTKSDAMAEKGGLIGIFFMAATLAIVSFSCTGPIIGAAIVQSATDKLGPFVVMLGFSTALALPFGLFAAFPGWLNTLPKSGGWMNLVKVQLGFLELALALKFLSVADMTMHWGILPYEVFMAAWVLIAAAMALSFFGILRFPHDSREKKLPAYRTVLGGLMLLVSFYLATGFRFDDKLQSYKSPGALSGLAPPARYNIFLTELNDDLDPDIKARYPSYSKSANNLNCFKDYYEGLAYAREVNKPILLDFTGYGCVNCRKVEEHVWIDERVWNKIANDYVLISLYVDDRQPLEAVLWSKHRNEKLRNVGNKWTDFQVVNFLQNTQPLYVLITPDEQVLTPPRGYKEGIKEYVNFLDCGLFAFDGITTEQKEIGEILQGN
ncbi:MAG: thioredoxin family protein [Saprospiraceae bacterium]|nr:thioredoxin family protein [Saprospiraceae bacterium]